MEPVKLHHPVPTRQTYVPEPPSTPASPHDYMRISSAQTRSPPQQRFAQTYPQQQQQPYGHHQPPPPGPQYPQYGQHPPPPPGQPAYGFGSSTTTPWGVNDATAQLGMQLGQSAMAAGSEYMRQNFGSAYIPVSALKHQFQVSNTYVLNKLRLVLFPWRHKPWYRTAVRAEGAQSENFLPPRSDINSPDLYIPSMALVTYVLLAAVRLGLAGAFNPRILGGTTSSAVFCIFIEVVLVKLAIYLLNINGAASVVELAAYAGYKFVGVIVTLFTELVTTNRWLYWAMFLYVFAANGLFLIRSLRYVVLPESSQGAPQTYTPAQRSRRATFLIIVAVCQLPLMLLLVS